MLLICLNYIFYFWLILILPCAVAFVPYLYGHTPFTLFHLLRAHLGYTHSHRLSFLIHNNYLITPLNSFRKIQNSWPHQVPSLQNEWYRSIINDDPSPLYFFPH